MKLQNYGRKYTENGQPGPIWQSSLSPELCHRGTMFGYSGKELVTVAKSAMGSCGVGERRTLSSFFCYRDIYICVYICMLHMCTTYVNKKCIR